MSYLNLSRALGVFMLALSPALSGCLATMYVHDKAEKRNTTTTVHLSDTITHIGTPKSELKEFPYALVLVGNKNSYLLTSPNQYRPSLLREIFTSVDTHYLYIKPMAGISNWDSVKKPKNYLRVNIADDICYKQNKICNTVEVIYYKPKSVAAKNEETKLKELGFTCDTLKNPKGDMLECSQKVGITIHLANKIPNKNLPHHLKQPIEFNVIEEHTQHRTNKAMMMLMPVALAVDVVTLPIQMAVGMHMLKKYP